MTKNKLLFNSIISIIIIFICVFIFLNKSNDNFTFYDIFSHIYNGWIYLISASFLLILSVYIRSFRWKYLFQTNKSQPTQVLFSAQLVGYFINNITPIRIGDFAKSYLIAKKTEENTSYVLGSIIMERVLDTLMLFIGMLIIIWNYGLVYLNLNFYCLTNQIYIYLFLMLIALLSVYSARNFIPIKIKNILYEIWDGFSSIDFSNKSLVIFSSIFIWLIYWFNVFLIQLIFPFLELTFIDCLFILVASSFIQMIPTGFGALGIFHLGVESVLIKLQINNYYHFLVLLWFYSYFVYTTLGDYYFIKEGEFTFKNLYNDLIKNH